VFAAYNPLYDEYTIYFPLVGSSLIVGWTFNFRTKAWTYNEFQGLSSADDIELVSGLITIDDLVGLIDDLVGTIDELSATDGSISTRVMGRIDGTLMTPDPTRDYDPALFTGDDYFFETDIISKMFVLPENDMYIAKLVHEYVAHLAGQIQFEYSLDGGESDENWRIAKSKEITVMEKKLLVQVKRNIRTRKYAWRVRATNGRFKLMRYEIHAYPGGESTDAEQTR
jgi:hypothetical protein